MVGLTIMGQVQFGRGGYPGSFFSGSFNDGPFVPYLDRDLKPFEVVAHRGARITPDPATIAPANTMPAFQEAARVGASIELDVLATQDGRLVVHHDDKLGHVYLSPTQEVAPSIRSLTFNQIQQARLNVEGHQADVNKMLGPVGSYHQSVYQTPEPVPMIKIPELSDVVLGLPKTHFYLELKTDNDQVKKGQNNALEERIVKLIQDNNLYDRVTVISFSTASLRKIKKLDSAIKTGLDFKLPKALQTLTALLTPYVNRFMKHYVGVQSIHPPYQHTSEKLVSAAHKAGLTIAPWVWGQTVSEEKAYLPKLISMGVDGIITNAPEALKKDLKV